ncbi:MAG: pilin [Patescibacteria group bacterium]
MFKKIIAFLVLFAAFYFPTSALANVSGVKYCDPCCEDSACSVPKQGICAGFGSPCETKTVGTKIVGTGEVGQCQPSDGSVVFCNLSKHQSISDVVDEVTKWIFILAMVIAPLMILLGGFYMLTSRGDPKMSNTGKEIIKWAIIGLAVILFAKAFVSIIRMVLK